jgi:hypothetical protein
MGGDLKPPPFYSHINRFNLQKKNGMRILYLWIFVCLCGLWSNSALADRLFVWNKSPVDYLAYKSDGKAVYVPPNTPYVTATQDITFYSLDAINSSIRRGELFVQFEGDTKTYVAGRFYEFWDYVNDNFAVNTVSVLEFSYPSTNLANASIKTSSSTGYIVGLGSANEFPWTYFDGVQSQNISVYPRQVIDWEVDSSRLRLRVDGRVPDSDYGQHPDAPENFGSVYAISFMDYPFQYDAYVYPTPRTPQRWSDAKMATFARKRPAQLNGALFDPEAITSDLREISSLPPDIFNENYNDSINSWLGEGIPDTSNNVDADGIAPPGDIRSTEETGDATLQDVVDALEDLSLEIPEPEYLGLTPDVAYAEPGWVTWNESDWGTSDLDTGSGQINTQGRSNGEMLPAYFEIGEHKIPFGMMFKVYPMKVICEWLLIVFSAGIYISFGMLVLNDAKDLFIGLTNVNQTTGNTETSGGVGFAQISSRVPSAVANYAIISSTIIVFSGTIFGVLGSGLVPDWNFTGILQEVFNQAPFAVKLVIGLMEQFFPLTLLCEMTIATIAFKIISLTTYGVATLAIKSASA